MDESAFVIRPIKPSDLGWLCDIAHLIGTGFTSVPDNKKFLSARVDIVAKSFDQKIPREQMVFLFGLELVETGKLIGLCGIQVEAGYKEPFYNYQISNITQVCSQLNIYLDHKVLKVVDNFQTASELISFWINPEYRGKKFSRALSFSRLLFIAHNSNLFGNNIIAEIRGVVDEHGDNPFWDAVGRHFFKMDFKTADSLTMTIGKQYISDLLPRETLYYDLLPESAQKVIGIPHVESAPAKHLLESQGLKYNNYVDIFDAGPLLNAEQQDIKIIRDSKLASIENITEKITNGLFVMIYNGKIDALITTGFILVNPENKITIERDTAAILKLQVGDKARFVGI